MKRVQVEKRRHPDILRDEEGPVTPINELEKGLLIDKEIGRAHV